MMITTSPVWLASILVSCWILRAANAWSRPTVTNMVVPALKQQHYRQLATIALVTTTCLVQPSLAFDPSVYNHDYADPLHPFCKRNVRVDGNVFHYTGTAVGPKDDTVLRGCTPAEIKEFGIRRGAFDGIIAPDGRISAGDGIHEGIWEPANSVSTNKGYEDVDGIRWNDGNKWTVTTKQLTTRLGEFIFIAYIAISILAGFKGAGDIIQRRQGK